MTVKYPKKKVEVQIDGNPVGTITVPSNVTERQKVLAACKLPGVLDQLKKTGVKASTWDETTYNILTKPLSIVDSFDFNRAIIEGKGKVKGKSHLKENPFQGLGIP